MEKRFSCAKGIRLIGFQRDLKPTMPNLRSCFPNKVVVKNRVVCVVFWNNFKIEIKLVFETFYSCDASWFTSSPRV